MRIRLGIIALLAMVSAAHAKDCAEGKKDVLELQKWSASKGVIGTAIEYVVKNNTGRSFRMVDASIFFDDKLGNHIGGYKFAPDLKMASNDIATVKGSVLGGERLMKANQEDLVVWTCTKSAILDNGERIEFN